MSRRIMFIEPALFSANIDAALGLRANRANRNFWNSLASLPERESDDKIREFVENAFSSVRWLDASEQIDEFTLVKSGIGNTFLRSDGKTVKFLHVSGGGNEEIWQWRIGEKPDPSWITRESLEKELMEIVHALRLDDVCYWLNMGIPTREIVNRKTNYRLSEQEVSSFVEETLSKVELAKEEMRERRWNACLSILNQILWPKPQAESDNENYVTDYDKLVFYYAISSVKKIVQ